MRELLYNAARHFKRGRSLLERGDVRGALLAFEEALRDLHAVKPQRMRDVLLAQVYLSRYQAASEVDPGTARTDLQLGYSYARTTREPSVRQLAETLLRGDRDRQRAPTRAPDGELRDRRAS
jgi:hypothetical protein